MATSTTQQPWWTFGITQRHGQNGEQGVDIGTPFHTPLVNVFGGFVQSASYGPWGGDVKIAIAGAPGYTEEFLHPDQLLVQVGQYVSPGQIIGLSGGQNVGGSHPASTRFSSGPHTEFDIAQNGTYLDPTSVVQRLAGIGTAIGASPIVAAQDAASAGVSAAQQPWWPFGPITASATQPTQATRIAASEVKNAVPQLPAWLEAPAQAILHDLAIRTILVVVGFILVTIGLLVLFFGGSIGGESPASHTARAVKVGATLAGK